MSVYISFVRNFVRNINAVSTINKVNVLPLYKLPNRQVVVFLQRSKVDSAYLYIYRHYTFLYKIVESPTQRFFVVITLIWSYDFWSYSYILITIKTTTYDTLLNFIILHMKLLYSDENQSSIIRNIIKYLYRVSQRKVVNFYISNVYLVYCRLDLETLYHNI